MSCSFSGISRKAEDKFSVYSFDSCFDIHQIPHEVRSIHRIYYHDENPKSPPTDHLIKRRSCFYKFIKKILAVLPAFAWIALGLIACYYSAFPWWQFLLSLGALAGVLFILYRLHMRYNRSRYYFFTDQAQPASNLFSDYLREIIESAPDKSGSCLSRLFPKPAYTIVVRVHSGYERLPEKNRQSITQALHLAVRFYRLDQARVMTDRFLPARFTAMQYLPELATALCSLWAITCGAKTLVGPWILWSLFLITICWMIRRMTALIHTMRLWAPALGYLSTHPAFTDISVIYPQKAFLWQNYSRTIFHIHDLMVGWVSQVFIGVYLFLFIGMASWSNSAQLWPQFSEEISSLFHLTFIFH